MKKFLKDFKELIYILSAIAGIVGLFGGQKVYHHFYKHTVQIQKDIYKTSDEGVRRKIEQDIYKTSDEEVRRKIEQDLEEGSHK